METAKIYHNAILWGLTFILVALNTQCSNSQTFCTEPGTERFAGEQDGFRYELWNQYGQGTACMTLDTGALFSGEWSDIENYLARRGLGYDQTQTHQEIGTFYSTFNCSYNPSSTSGNSYLSIYGWTVDPLKEYYIVEDWRNWIPSMDANAKKKGSFEVDGSVYDIYENTRVNQPSIIGNTTFQQYFSIRRKTRNSGTISISEHFKKWEELGLVLGNLYEVSFVVEGYKSKGNFNFNALDIFVDNTIPVNAELPETTLIQVITNNNAITLKLNENAINATVEIFDSMGKKVYKNLYAYDNLQVSGLTAGVYFIRLSGKGLNYRTKFLVN